MRIRVQKTTMRAYDAAMENEKKQARRRMFHERLGVQAKKVVRLLDSQCLTPVEVCQLGMLAQFLLVTDIM